MGKKPNLLSTISTRDRILSAAMLRFSRQSYDQTGLREIAADAGVDVAYVHRCFGSKHQLFAEVISSAVQADHIFENLSHDLIDVLMQRALRASPLATDDVDPLDIAVRSLSCPEAIEVHRDFVRKDLIEPLSEHLEDATKRRAALIVAFLTGLSILRNVIGIKELRETKGGELEAMVRDVLRGLSSNNIPAHRK